MNYTESQNCANPEKTFVVGVDIGSETNFARVSNWYGLELKGNSFGKHHGRSSINKRGRKKLRKSLFQVMLPWTGRTKEFEMPPRADDPVRHGRFATAVRLGFTQGRYSAHKTLLLTYPFLPAKRTNHCELMQIDVHWL